MKEQILDVPRDILETVGAVSEETAAAMAEGICRLTGADVGISVTGIAGPNSDGTRKPVGLVYIAVCMDGATKVFENHFAGDREAIRNQSIEAALKLPLL
jgi:nicotinamide-nucleotide amidase